MPIENRNLKPGTRLVGRYHKQPYVCEVLEGDGGKLSYRLEDGRELKSPSAAGMAVTGHACDGWVFWSVETAKAASVPQMEHAEAEQEDPAETETTETGSKGANEEVQADVDKKSVCRRIPNQKGVLEGQVRWHCYACRKTFLFPAAQVPKSCPGHPVS